MSDWKRDELAEAKVELDDLRAKLARAKLAAAEAVIEAARELAVADPWEDTDEKEEHPWDAAVFSLRTAVAALDAISPTETPQP